MKLYWSGKLMLKFPLRIGFSHSCSFIFPPSLGSPWSLLGTYFLHNKRDGYFLLHIEATVLLHVPYSFRLGTSPDSPNTHIRTSTWFSNRGEPGTVAVRNLSWDYFFRFIYIYIYIGFQFWVLKRTTSRSGQECLSLKNQWATVEWFTRARIWFFIGYTVKQNQTLSTSQGYPWSGQSRQG